MNGLKYKERIEKIFQLNDTPKLVHRSTVMARMIVGVVKHMQIMLESLKGDNRGIT